MELRLLGYQFGSTPGTRGDWDANWLLLGGHARTLDGRAWSFRDPSLTTWDARDLAAWLREVIAGHVQPIDSTGADDEDLLLRFTEPDLAFSLARRSDVDLTLRVHLSLESRPPWLNDKDTDLYEYVVPITCTTDELAAATDQWMTDLRAFPAR
nr:hypothetical protein [Cellulomonas sp. NS3]